MKIEDWWGGPEKIVMNADSNPVRLQPRTISVEVGLPLPEDMEAVVLWVLVREFRGIYFCFRTHIPYIGELPPTRVLSARFWFEGKPHENRLTTELKRRMTELIEKAVAFTSPSGFLLNQSNADWKEKMVVETHQDFPDDNWVIWEN